MANVLLESHEHYCFHSVHMNTHTHPDLHHCNEENCNGVVQHDMAKRAGLVNEEGTVLCPECRCHTTLKGGKRVVEVHAKLCTDATIHYPALYKAGKLDKETYEAWKATLTLDELHGRYRRVPDAHVVANFTHEEALLIETDLEAFNKLLNERIRERAEKTLIHQVQHRHTTESTTIKL